jgi:hypothetical protein
MTPFDNQQSLATANTQSQVLGSITDSLTDLLARNNRQSSSGSLAVDQQPSLQIDRTSIPESVIQVERSIPKPNALLVEKSSVQEDLSGVPSFGRGQPEQALNPELGISQDDSLEVPEFNSSRLKEVKSNVDQESPQVPQQSPTTNSFPKAGTSLIPQILFASAAIDQKPSLDQLTQQDASAIATMLSSKSGDKIPNAEGLRIKINGKVVAEVGADGILSRSDDSLPKNLPTYFSNLSKDTDRPISGAKAAELFIDNMPPSSGVKGFMTRVFSDLNEQKRQQLDRQLSPDLVKASKTEVNAVMGLYALKEPLSSENSDRPAPGVYALKPFENGQDVGSITVSNRGDYQDYTVSTVEGDVEMQFTVNTKGTTIGEPKISGRLQGEIASLNQAFSAGKLDNPPLISTDLVRAQAAYSLAQNLGNSSSKKIPDLQTSKDGRSGNISGKSSQGSIFVARNSSRVKGQTVGTGFTLRSTNLSTEAIDNLNKSFDSAKTQDLSKNLSKPPLQPKSKSKAVDRGGR